MAAVGAAKDRAEANSPPLASATAAASGSAGGRSPDLQAAIVLHDNGHYAQALPKLETLSAANPEAELYAARCLVHTKGCSSAVSRFDSAASRSLGTEISSRATLEAARCYTQMGQPLAARTRYEQLQTDNYVAMEANSELASLSAPPAAAAAKAGPAQARPPAAIKAAKPAATTTTRAKAADVDNAY
jgi:hypothetical protein